MTKSNSSLFSIIIIVTFLITVSVPLTGALLQEDRGLSYSEKRKLQQFPPYPKKVGELAGFITDFEKYFNDQFGLRELFIGSYASLKKMIGDHDISSAAVNIGTKNIIEGKSGWFFLNRKWDGDPVSDYRNIHLYSEASLLRSMLLFAARAYWLKSQGIEYLIFFAPNKHTVYSEYLPDYLTKIGDISSLDQLHDSLSRNTNVHFVDLRQTLKNSKGEAARYWKERKEEARIYYKKDSHWNGAGADIAQYTIALKLADLFPGKIQPLKRNADDFVMISFAGDITLIMGRKDKEAYGPVLMGGTCTPETFDDYLKRHHVTLCSSNLIDAVIFNDSFLPPLKPYFSDYFRRTSYHWESATRGRIEQEIKVNKPDIVVEQRAERFMPFTPAALNENYNAFWQKHWPKWRKIVYRLDLQAAGRGQYKSSNLTTAYLGADKVLSLNGLNIDPQLYLPKITIQKGKIYLVKVVISSDQQTMLQLYYGTAGKEDSFPAESSSYSQPIKKGKNEIYVPLFSMDFSGDLRLDPGKKKGVYLLHELVVKELDEVKVK